MLFAAMDEDRGTIKKILKIWSADRKTRKGIVANSVEDLTAQCMFSFSILLLLLNIIKGKYWKLEIWKTAYKLNNFN